MTVRPTKAVIEVATPAVAALPLEFSWTKTPGNLTGIGMDAPRARRRRRARIQICLGGHGGLLQFYIVVSKISAVVALPGDISKRSTAFRSWVSPWAMRRVISPTSI